MRSDEDILAEILTLVRELGWSIAMQEEGDNISHMIMGDEDALDAIDEVLGGYCIFVPNDEDKVILH